MAVALIRKFKFKLGLQLMLGLPADNEKRFTKSVVDVISLKPDFARLCPTLVLRHTPLYSLYKKGLYAPWSMGRTLNALKNGIKAFENAGIPIIRVGLQADDSLNKNLVAGPFHPSLRYLIDCQIGLDRMINKIASLNHIPKIILFKVPKKLVSIYIGDRRENLRLLKEQFGLDEIHLSGEEKCHELELVA